MLDLLSLKKENSLFDNRYRLIEKIGSGGFSEVWLSYDCQARVDVVLKVYASSMNLDAEGVNMFREEFSIICSLNHTNILKPFSFNIYQGTPYLVLPYCEKGSTAKLIAKISEENLWIFVEQVASGLSYLHKHAIIHQDIKPANILINADNQFLITDFGISTGLRNTIRGKNGSPNEHSGAGTTAYMAYECLASNPSNVISRDIWALGATLYELVTGEVPFGEYGGITQKSLNGKVPKIERDISKELKSLIYKCLSLNTWDRPSAEEILEEIRKHNGTSVKSPSWKKFAIVSAGIAAVVIVGFVAGKRIAHSPLHPNDSTFLAKIEVANGLVEMEKEKANIDSIDELQLSKAAQIYRNALQMEVTDKTGEIGREKWQVAQAFIDTIYVYFRGKQTEYAEIGAENAAKVFSNRSLVLEDFISEAVKSTSVTDAENGIRTEY